jgi:hypothetical protein
MIASQKNHLLCTPRKVKINNGPLATTSQQLPTGQYIRSQHLNFKYWLFCFSLLFYC